MRVRALFISVSVLMGLSAAAAQAQQPLPRDLELELASSALPPHLRADATVYWFDPAQGLAVARAGANGFHAFVSRLDPAVFAGSWEYTEHPSDVLLPIAFDAAGARQPMRVFFDAHELLARGTPALELKELMWARLESGYYAPHERAGVAYMLSPVLRAYPDPYSSPRRVTRNIPHRMFYAPFIENEDIGGDPRTNEPFVIQPGPHGYIVVRAHPTERRAITESYGALVKRLCRLNRVYCLDAGHEG